MLYIEEITEKDKLNKVKEQWEELINKSNIKTPFLTFEWVAAWLNYFGGKAQLIILLIKEEGNVLAIAPLMIKKVFFLGLPIIKVQFIGGGEANYSDFIAENLTKECLINILDYIKKRYKWNIIDLTDIVGFSSSLDAFRQLRADKFKFAILETEICPYLTIQADWDSYFRTQMKKKARYNLQRQIKLLQSRGRLEFKRVKQADNWGALIGSAVKIYQKDWSGKFNASTFLRNEYTGFYIDIAKEFSKQGWIDFSYLALDGKMIAFSYGFRFDNKLIDYLIGYDPQLSEFSPGSCLLRFQVEEAFKQNLKEFDFSKGREPYKLRWQSAERKNYRIIIANDGPYAKLIWILHIVYHRIRYGCKGSFALRNLRKRILGSFKEKSAN